ncbi:MAG: transposase [Cyclobacteriaceae bacterium]
MLQEGEYYHVYNRGNDKQPIFPLDRNYDYFLQKLRKYLLPRCEILAWCLMPNHFHLMILATENTTRVVKERPLPMSNLMEGIRHLLSSYTKAIQVQEQRTGSLFQQKTKCKVASEYAIDLIRYIHQNPVKAGLVNKAEDWRWSSLMEYDSEQPILCNLELTYRNLLLCKADILEACEKELRPEILQKIEGR